MGHFLDAARRAFGHAGAATELAERKAENPEVQLFQVAEDTEANHKLVVAAATDAMALANQANAAYQSAVAERDRLERLTVQALKQLEAAKSADPPDDKVIANKTAAAQSLGTKLTAAKAAVDRAQAAAQQADAVKAKAKANVKTSEELVHQRTAQAAEVHGDLASAKMSEAMHTALAATNNAMAPHDGPSFDEVKANVAARLAHAQAAEELDESTDAAAELQVEHDAAMAETDDTLAALRAQYGIGVEATPAASSPEPATAAVG